MDGHDLPELTKILRYAASLKEPVLLHVKTVKGKGFAPAERNPDAFHGVSPLIRRRARPGKRGESFSRVFGRTLVRLARNDGRICAPDGRYGGRDRADRLCGRPIPSAF